jgi:hypothetical protein
VTGRSGGLGRGLSLGSPRQQRQNDAPRGRRGCSEQAERADPPRGRRGFHRGASKGSRVKPQAPCERGHRAEPARCGERSQRFFTAEQAEESRVDPELLVIGGAGRNSNCAEETPPHLLLCGSRGDAPAGAPAGLVAGHTPDERGNHKRTLDTAPRSSGVCPVTGRTAGPRIAQTPVSLQLGRLVADHGGDARGASR